MSTHDMVDADDLDDLHESILDELHRGRCTPSYLAEVTSESRQLVSHRLRDLVMSDNVWKVHKGLYELESDPRDWTQNLRPIVRGWYESRQPQQGVIQNLQHGLNQIEAAALPESVRHRLVYEFVEWFDSEFDGSSGPHIDAVERTADTMLNELRDDNG